MSFAPGNFARVISRFGDKPRGQMVLALTIVSCGGTRTRILDEMKEAIRDKVWLDKIDGEMTRELQLFCESSKTILSRINST